MRHIQPSHAEEYPCGADPRAGSDAGPNLLEVPGDHLLEPLEELPKVLDG